MPKTPVIIACVLLSFCAWPARQSIAAPNPVLVPIPTPSAQVSAPADPAHFTFIVGGDNRPPAHGDPMPPSLGEICTEIGWIRPDFVIWTGDAIEGYDDTPEDASAEYDAFLSSAALCQSPIFAIPGNHEIAAANLVDPYVKRMGALYGSFDYGNSHFIGLDSTPVISGAVDEGDFDDAQWQWLTQDLAAHAGKSANIFVFFHHYVFGPASTDDTGLKSTAVRDRVHQLFVKYGVRAVFCGHDHLYYHVAKDGVDYFIAGNAGAPMDASPDQGGFLGYMLVQVEGNKITTEPLPAWDLRVRTLQGGDGTSPTASVAVDNSEYYELALRGVTVTMPAGVAYGVTAAAMYKGKNKSVDTSIVSQTPSADGKTVLLTIVASAPHARTTILTIGASSQAGEAGSK